VTYVGTLACTTADKANYHFQASSPRCRYCTANPHGFGNMLKTFIPCQAIGRRFDKDALLVASVEVDGARSDTKWAGGEKSTG